MSHTPGPWRQGGMKELMLNQKCREIVADEGRIGLVYGIADDDNKANARLIAAAPELLEIVRELAAIKTWSEADGNYVYWVGESLVQKAEDILKMSAVQTESNEGDKGR